jgi:serine/threonine protein kinase
VTDGEDVLIAGRYRLITALASGGMGVVWKGWDERLHREVAIKQLRVQPGLRPAEATTARDRAMREARNTARLHHPHAVPVYDVVEQDGEPCLIMEFLPCISLQESIKQRGTLPPAEVARIGAEVAQALSAAHKAGIVHRDVKPGNVLLAEDGTTKLTDFGISHALGDVALTATGMLTGTPAYLAPEVARGQPANFASDVFSLGATLYSASEGTPPFGEDVNAMAVLHRVASGQFRKPQRSGPLTPLLEEMLAGDPDKRPSMPQVARTLTLVHTQNSAAETAGSTSASSLETARYTRPQRRPEPEPPPPVLPPPPVQSTVRPAPLPVLSPMTLADVRPAAPAAGGSRRRGALIAAVLTSAVVIAAIVIAVALMNKNKNPTGSAAGGQTSSSPRTSAPAQKSSTGGSSPAASTSSQTSATASTTASSASHPAPGGAASAGQLAQAISDYYALLPQNTQAAWARLTPAYRQGEPGGFADYQQFWARFSKVTTSNVTGQPPDSVRATIQYTLKNGGTDTETRTFQLIRSDGRWKINASSVV